MNTFPKDIAYNKLTSILPSLGALIEDKNEATTRLRVIDRIIFEILLWETTDVDVETYCRAIGYADYVFSVSNKPLLVLEAKKSGVEFLLENNNFKDRPYQFSLLAQECKPATDALKQAIGYAASLGARYVAISNGHQWIFTLTFVANQSVENRLVYVFESFEGIRKKFSSFCKCFNKEGLSSNIISRTLLDSRQMPAPAKLSAQIPGYPQSSSRNRFENELSYILDYVWRIMSQSENSVAFVKNCYVNPNSHHDILTLAKELIKKRRNEDDILAELEVKSIDKLPYMLANLPAEKPFVVLGDVGRGKSSFLKYLRFVAAKEILEDFIQIEINFLDRPDTYEEIPSLVYAEIERQLLETYKIDINDDKFVRQVLRHDLKKLKTTPRGKLLTNQPDEYSVYEVEKIEKITKDKHTYFAKVFHHLKGGHRKSLILFFDNLDRRSEKIQEESFLKSSAIARDWSCLVFICLRPTTFYNSREDGVLDTIAPTTFTVGHPDLSLVLKKRFAYAKQIAKGESLDSSGLQSPPSRDLSFDFPNVAKIFESCEFAAWKRHGIIPMLEAVSNGNLRVLLDIARKILCSGHLDTNKILDRIELSGKYVLPDFEGVKTLLYGDYKQYDPSKSPFINLFDVKHKDTTEHFILIAILNYLSGQNEDVDSYKYTNISELISYLASLGYSYAVSVDSIRNLINKKYIKQAIRKKTLNDEDSVQLSTLGKYHIFNLISEFQYLDATIVDTPILDETIKDKLDNVYNIGERVQRTELFLEYLNNAVSQIEDSELRKLWENIFLDSHKKLKEVKSRI